MAAVRKDYPLPPIAWAPYPGSQQAFLTCPIFEVLIEGNRGGGKSDCVLVDYGQHVGAGFGRDWKGIVFRESFPQLEEMINKSHSIFKPLGGRFTGGNVPLWRFPGGERFMFRVIKRPSDYNNQHGWECPFIAFEELTNWATPACYTPIISIMRSAKKGVPKKLRANCNPSGVGHNWVKKRFGLPVDPGRMCTDVITDAVSGLKRVAIKSRLDENKALMEADPEYLQRIAASAASRAQLLAWRDGRWDIIAGGMFDDLWETDRNGAMCVGIHVVPSIPFDRIPSGWRINRSYDHGQTKPFSVGWWAESNGEPIVVEGRQLGIVKGDLFRIAEWYGCKVSNLKEGGGMETESNKGLNLSALDIARGIKEREKAWKIASRVRQGPADTQIFTTDASQSKETGDKSVATDMASEGVHWDKANKDRINGWQQVRKRLKGSIPGENGYREDPGLFVTTRCRDFIALFPATSRDPKLPEDVDTECEDHIADETRYRVMSETPVFKTDWSAYL